MHDFIPPRDAELDEWLKNFSNYVSANYSSLGLTQAESDEFSDLFENWETDFKDHLRARAQASAAAQKKKETKSIIVKKARILSAKFQANPNVTKDQKAALNITIAKEKRRSVPAPQSAPMGTIDNSHRLKHLITFFDSESPQKKAKPEGVKGCEIWMKIGGDPPKGKSEMEYLATDTRSPYEVNFSGEHAGKNAHYMLRWVGSTGKTGPWSETLRYTISG